MRRFSTGASPSGKRPTDYSKIHALEDFDLFNKFWVYARDWKSWKVGWTSPSPSSTRRRWNKRCGRLQGDVQDGQTVRLQETADVRRKLRDDTPRAGRSVHTPSLALRSPGMRDRHWEQIAEDVGVRVPYDDPEFNLWKLTEMGTAPRGRG